jgi:hypothetical protein
MVKYRKKTSDWSVQQIDESQRAVSSKIDRVDRSRTTSPLPVRGTAIRRRTISTNQTISSARLARGKTISAKETIFGQKYPGQAKLSPWMQVVVGGIGWAIGRANGGGAKDIYRSRDLAEAHGT